MRSIDGMRWNKKISNGANIGSDIYGGFGVVRDHGRERYRK